MFRTSHIVCTFLKALTTLLKKDWKWEESERKNYNIRRCSDGRDQKTVKYCPAGKKKKGQTTAKRQKDVDEKIAV